MAAGRASAAAERAAVQKAVVWFDRRMGPILGTSKRVAKADFRYFDDKHNYDCWDTTRNTTSLLLVLREWGLLQGRNHVPAPASRFDREIPPRRTPGPRRHATAGATQGAGPGSPTPPGTSCRRSSPPPCSAKLSCRTRRTSSSRASSARVSASCARTDRPARSRAAIARRFRRTLRAPPDTT